MGSLTGQTAIVTGGARGIGFGIARRLCADGARVVLFDRDGAEAAAERLRGEGHKATGADVDVSQQTAVDVATGAVLARGPLEILVNAAGIFPKVPFEEMTLQTWRQVLSVNLDGTFLCCRAAFPAMKAQRYGRIVNIGSAGFRKGNPGYAAYVASKGGMVGLTRVLANEGGPHGITCNVVAPGVIASDGALSSAVGRATLEAALAIQAVKTTGRPEDVAAAVAYVAGRDAGFITGQIIDVNGGSAFG